jgi:hypothetical protein
MPIERLGAEYKLRPDEIARVNMAFRKALRLLHLVNRNDPVTEIVARKVIAISATGIRDAKEIAKIAVKQLAVK